jgi:hypothetical protein
MDSDPTDWVATISFTVNDPTSCERSASSTMWAAAQNAARHISGVKNTPADSKENRACATKASLPNLVTVRITSFIVVMVLHR